MLVRNHPLTRNLAPGSIDVVVLAAYAVGRLWLTERDDMSAFHLAGAQASLRWVLRRAARTD